jgi:phosphoglycolate phosphatase-like HAD superfamily hydrolase
MPPRDSEPHFLEPLLGVVFDLDGTLVLSHHDFGRIRAEVIRIAQRHGVTPGHLSVQDPVHKIVEMTRDAMHTAGLPEGAFWQFDAEYQKAVDAIEMEALPRTVARPGAAALLKGLAGRGFRLGVLTRSSERFARSALRQTQLDPFFEYLRSRSSPGPAKPSPEALLLLLKEMAVPVQRALFVGDHLIDAECGTRAGVRFYAVLADASDTSNASMTKDRFLAAGASAIAQNLDELARHLGAAVPPRAA